MRNDFYVGIYEDTYLAHGAKGSVKKDHKYKARFWKNNKWHYIYQDLSNAMKSRYHQGAYKINKRFADFVEKTTKDYDLFAKQTERNFNSRRKAMMAKMTPRERKAFEEHEKRVANDTTFKNNRSKMDAMGKLQDKIQKRMLAEAKNKAAKHLQKVERYGRKSGEATAEWRKRIKDSKKRDKISNFTNNFKSELYTKSNKAVDDALDKFFPEKKKKYKLYTPQPVKVLNKYSYRPDKKKLAEKAKEQKLKQPNNSITNKAVRRNHVANVIDPYQESRNEAIRDVARAEKRDMIKTIDNLQKRYEAMGYAESTARNMAYEAFRGKVTTQNRAIDRYKEATTKQDEYYKAQKKKRRKK